MQRSGVSARAMCELAGVNQAFLALLMISHARDADTGRFGLDDECLARIGEGPFPLFSLRFHDVAAWSAILDRGVREDAGAPPWPATGGRQQQFMVMALAAIRAVAGREPVSASVLFGVPAVLAVELGRTEIRALPMLAEAVSPWLRAKCASMTDWWNELIVSARGTTGDGFQHHRGVHTSLVSALNLRRARLPGGRLYRRL
jgi:hypothetical protein